MDENQHTRLTLKIGDNPGLNWWFLHAAVDGRQEFQVVQGEYAEVIGAPKKLYQLPYVILLNGLGEEVARVVP